jgi:hypothetical protein
MDSNSISRLSFHLLRRILLNNQGFEVHREKTV